MSLKALTRSAYRHIRHKLDWGKYGRARWEYEPAASVPEHSALPLRCKPAGRPRAGRLLSAYCEAARRAFDRDGDLTFRYGFRFTRQFYLFAGKCAVGALLSLILLERPRFVPHHIGANPNVHTLHHNVINAT